MLVTWSTVWLIHMKRHCLMTRTHSHKNAFDQYFQAKSRSVDRKLRMCWGSLEQGVCHTTKIRDLDSGIATWLWLMIIVWKSRGPEVFHWYGVQKQLLLVVEKKRKKTTSHQCPSCTIPGIPLPYVFIEAMWNAIPTSWLWEHVHVYC